MFLFNSSFWRSVPGVLFGLVLLAGVVVGMWQVGWIFHTANVNRDAQVNQQGYANQSAMRSEITRKLGDVEQYTTQLENPAYKPEWHGIKESRSFAAQLVCGDAAQVTDGLPVNQAQWVTANCVDGTLSPNSVYALTTTPGA
jgi:hypothetical protein